MPKIKKTCPKLYQLLTNGLDDLFMVHDEVTKEEWIGSAVSGNPSKSLFCQIDDDLVDIVFEMVNTIVAI